MQQDIHHIEALYSRLRNEKGYLAIARDEQEIALRKVWIEQIKNELRAEGDPLGLCDVDECALDDDGLLNELLT